MDNMTIMFLKPLALFLIMILGMFVGMCIPCYIVLKQSEKEKPKIIDVINFTTYVIYKVIIEGGKL